MKILLISIGTRGDMEPFLAIGEILKEKGHQVICASMIIPHIIDQFVWNKTIYDMGAGPKGIKIGKITTKNLEPKILELVNNSTFKKKAEQVASQMGKDDFREKIYKSIIEK